MRNLLDRTIIEPKALAGAVTSEYKRIANQPYSRLLYQALQQSGAKHRDIFVIGEKLATALDRLPRAEQAQRIIQQPHDDTHTALIDPGKRLLVNLQLLNGLHARQEKPLPSDMRGMIYVHALAQTAGKAADSIIPTWFRDEARLHATTGVTGKIYRDAENLGLALTPGHAAAELASIKKSNDPKRLAGLQQLVETGFASSAAQIFTRNLQLNLAAPTSPVRSNTTSIHAPQPIPLAR